MENYIVEIPKAILVTGGIGDFIILETFFKSALRENLEIIYYATSQKNNIESLFNCFDNYPKLKKHISVWDDFKNIFCFVQKEELFLRDLTLKKKLRKVHDYSIIKIFPLIKYNIFKYNISSCIKYNLSNISKFDLPKKYAVICPYSYDKRNKNRDFTYLEWDIVLKILKRKKLKGVILNIGNDFIPKDKYLIDLSNQISLKESIDIVKKCDFYIGVDSCFSVIAAQILNNENLLIKSVNDHLYRWKNVYYFMKYDFSFLTENIRL